MICTLGMLGLGLLLLTQTAKAADDVPAWLSQIASQTIPIYDKRVAAVVLLNEQSITVDEEGKNTRVTNYAVRILSSEGKNSAAAHETYDTGTSSVRSLRAWLISPSGAVKKYGKDQVIDAALVDNDLYSEARMKVIRASGEAEIGSVFGFESTVENRSVFTQIGMPFQNESPVLVSRLRLSLPTGWQTRSLTFNHPPVEPTLIGLTSVWELRDLPFIEDEPAAPSISSLVPGIAVSYYPPPGVTTKNKVQTFSNWREVSQWLTQLSDSQADSNEALASHAHSLVSGRLTEFQKIRAIADYVQRVSYISIQMGVGRGGGYRPHLATQVFSKSYGDCKDKANLMRSMLRAVGIGSYLVAIYSGDPTYVRQEWASPHQFNHMILAIRVSDNVQAATVLQHPRFGPLMVFDPTDSNTPLGDLPGHEQGSLALVLAADAGELVRMPSTPPDTNRLDSKTEAVLSGSGAVTAVVKDKAVGQAAAFFRRLFRRRNPQEFSQMVERSVARRVNGARVTKIDPSDNPLTGGFELSLELTAEGYAQAMQNKLLMFTPSLGSSSQIPRLTAKTRKYPVLLESTALEKIIRFTLPEGFALDELPEPAEAELPFGRFSSFWKVQERQLLFTHSLRVKNAVIPASQYPEVRKFFEQVVTAEQSPVVLVRQ